MPTFVANAEVGWAGAASLTTPGLACQSGDLLVVLAATSSSSTKLSGTLANSGAALSWTLTSVTLANNVQVYAWRATVDTARTVTVTGSRSAGTGSWGMRALQYRGAVVGAVQTGSGSGVPSLTLTTTRDASDVAWVSGDWAGVTGTAAWTAGASVLTDTRPSSSRFYVACWSGVGVAGAKTVGQTAPSGQTWAAIGIEIADAAKVLSGAGSAAFSATASTVTERSVSGVGALVGSASGMVDRLLHCGAAVFSGSGLLTVRPSRWRTQSRTESYRYDLLGLDGTPAGVLSGVEACRLSGSIWADTRWSGSLDWSGRAAPDWRHLMVRPTYVVDGGGEFVLGTFLCRTTGTGRGVTDRLSVSVDLYDCGYRLSAWSRLPSSLSIPAGTVVTDAVVAQLVAAGVARYSVTPSTKALAAPMVWDAGETRLKVVNELLDAAGYWSAYADQYGTIVAEPYTAPGDRPPVWTFTPDPQTSIYLPGWADEVDDFDTPNRLSGVQRVTDGQTPLTYTATLDQIDPASPYGYAGRGHWIDGETLRDLDVADAAALKTAVDRELRSRAASTRKIHATHAWVPEVRLGSAVTFTPDGAPRRAVVGKQELSLGLGLRAVSEWVEV